VKKKGKGNPKAKKTKRKKEKKRPIGKKKGKKVTPPADRSSGEKRGGDGTRL